MRIVRQCRDEIDGVALAGFEVGLVYHMGPEVGSYLVASGYGESILEDEVSADELEEQQFRVNVRRWRAAAADTGPHKRVSPSRRRATAASSSRLRDDP